MNVLLKALIPAVVMAFLFLTAAQGQTAPPQTSGETIHPATELLHFAPPVSPEAPLENKVKNQQESPWELYRLPIIGIGAGFVGLILLVAFLVGFNRQLNTTRQALNRLNTSLESQVQERTAALSQTNRRLEAEVTERLQAEQALLSSEARYRLLTDNAPLAVAVIDLETGRVVYANKLAARLFELPLEQAVGTFAPDYYVDLQDRARLTEQLSAQGYIDDFETRLKKSSGQEFWASVTSHISTFDNRPAIHSVYLDITARKKSAEIVRQSEIQYRLLAENMVDVVWTMNPAGDFNYVSPSVERLRGYTPQEVLAQSPAEALTPASLQVMQKIMTETMPHLLQGAQNFKLEPMASELEQPRKDGSTVWTEAIVKVLFDERGNFSGFLGLSRDITERKQAQAATEAARMAAEAANQAKSVFLANMSHELRTPLNGILGYAQLLRAYTNLDEEQRQYVITVERSGLHLLALIDDVLDIAKIEAGRIALNPSYFYLQSFLTTISDMIGIRAAQKGISFKTDFEAHLPELVCGDETRLRQILVNLLGNAVKFTEVGGVTFQVQAITQNSVEAATALLRFTIIDTGSGIPVQERENIFQPFYQVLEQSQFQGGTGLGLSISQHLAQLMGSNIQIANTPGPGSIFWFEITAPTGGAPPEQVAQPQAKIVGYLGNRHKILVVDDDAANRKILYDILTPLGFAIVEAGDGLHGLELADQHQPDLILLDMRMPRLDGAAMAARLRQTAQFRDIPLIGVSASAFELDRQNCLAAGCDNFLPKPIHLPDLLAAIATRLHLDWVYASSSLDDGVLATADIDITLPPANVLTALKKSALIGDVSAIKHQLGQIEEMDQVYRPFVIQLRKLADQFRLEALQSYVEQKEAIQ